MDVLNALADAVSIASGVVVISGGLYALKIWRDRQRPPFCLWCGLSNHAPQSDRVRAYPRNPEGKVGHNW